MVCLGEGSSGSLISARLSQFPFPLGCRGCARSPSGQPGCAPPATPPSPLPWPLCDLATSSLHPAPDLPWNSIPANLLTSRCLIPKGAVGKTKKKKPKQPKQNKKTTNKKTPTKQRNLKLKTNKTPNKTIKANQTKKPVPVLYPWSRDGG